MISALNRGQEVQVDEEVHDALFLRRNFGWKPEDLGYPENDYILRDLMGLID